MIIGISGKIGSGKDTVGSIIQYLVIEEMLNKQRKELPALMPIVPFNEYNLTALQKLSSYQIMKFADYLKDIVCGLINCTREQLEDPVFKNTELGEKWKRWFVYTKALKDINELNRLPLYYSTEKEAKSIVNKILESTGNKLSIDSEVLTPRTLLQLLGTECGRNIIHPNVWVNALMSKYKTCEHKCLKAGSNYCGDNKYDCTEVPNWIITDTRFPNELKAV
jgi:hypothetical protein